SKVVGSLEASRGGICTPWVRSRSTLRPLRSSFGAGANSPLFPEGTDLGGWARAGAPARAASAAAARRVREGRLAADMAASGGKGEEARAPKAGARQGGPISSG